ncbi:MAG: hypothetical protein WAK48_03695 [Candidatus Acidiferrum sp.]|jgi:hypothetical protein
MSHKSDSVERIAQRQSLYGLKKGGISSGHDFSRGGKQKERTALAAEGMPIPSRHHRLPSTYFVTLRTLLIGSGLIIIGQACFVLRAFLSFALRRFAGECIEVTSPIAPDRSAEELCVEASILACFNTSPVLRNLDYQNA